MADYISIAVTVFLLNIVPAFMPPTWVALALAKANDPGMDPLMLTLTGAIASTAGRALLMFYSGFFRRFMSKELELHAQTLQKFFEKKGKELFLGTFIYSLSPFPSNLVFIANGLTKTDSKPVFAGFFLGRFVSYYALIAISGHIFALLNGYFKNDVYVSYIFDAAGILAAVSILFIHWEKYLGGNDGKQKSAGSKKSP